MERDAGEYRRKDLFEFRRFNATRLEVQRGDETIAVEKTESDADDEEDTWRQVVPESTDLDQAKVNDLLLQISGLRAESFVVARDDAGLRDEQVVATVRARFGDDNTDETVVVWRSGEDTFAVPEGEPGAAKISTNLDQVVDVFYVRDKGGKIEDPQQLETIRSTLLAAIEELD